MKQPIYLIDLTHDTPLGYGSDTMPMQLGLVAGYCLQSLSDQVEIQIFKFVDELMEAVKARPPFMLGASNYVWNLDLTYQVTSAIKERFPQTLVVYGGPNYPDVAEEQIEWLTQYPGIDIHVFRDGEVPFNRLVRHMLENGDIQSVRRACLPSCHAVVDGQAYIGELEPRLKELDQIPSPYVLGLMDKFFEQRLIPAIRTNRGCPFPCTFCAEGHDYYNKVYKTSFDWKKEEIDYIAARIKHTKTLRIADSNFGMYKDDIEFCRYLGEIQARTGYPEYINCATGKNKKELVLECNKLVKGAMRLTASVQSLNLVVLENTKRNNISVDAIMALSDAVSDTDTHAYSEIILALPGDSLAAEKETFAGLIKSGIGNITQHQLSLIPGTEMASKADKEKYGMKSMFRPIQRCLGQYRVFDQQIVAIEVEDVCVANNTLSFEDYLEARRLYLTVGLFYNDRIFGEIHGLLRILHLSTWDWLLRIHESIAALPLEIRELYDAFTRDTKNELWADKTQLIQEVSAEIEQYVAGKSGGNLIYKYRAKALVQHYDQLHEVAFKYLQGYLEDHSAFDEEIVADVAKFSRFQKGDIFNTESEATELFGLDMVRLIKEPALARSGNGLSEIRQSRRIRIYHSNSQKAAIQREIGFYGKSQAGLTMLLSRYPLKRFYRVAEAQPC